MEKLTFVIPTLLGVEGLTAEELRRMGMEGVRAENGRVFCQGDPGDIPRLNLRLRTGERVLVQLGTFPAVTFEELFQGTQALPWEDFIPRGGAFPVKGFSLNSALHSVPACQSIVKKAVATRLGRIYHQNTLPEDGPVYQIQFSLMKDVASLLLDTTGPGLYKRGYRAVGVAAPLRETLAAALVMLSGERSLLRPLLRLGDHCDRGRPHRQKPCPRPQPHLFCPEVGLAALPDLGGRGRRGHGLGVRWRL